MVRMKAATEIGAVTGFESAPVPSMAEAAGPVAA